VCCDSTACDAFSRDYKVIFLSDGAATGDLPDLGFGSVSASAMLALAETLAAYHHPAVPVIDAGYQGGFTEGALRRLAICSTARRLDRTSSIDNRNEISLVLCTTAAALELGSLLDRKRHMMDVPVDLR
jgi:hypothetical protein